MQEQPLLWRRGTPPHTRGNVKGDVSGNFEFLGWAKFANPLWFGHSFEGNPTMKSAFKGNHLDFLNPFVLDNS